jgi:membrane fusion protein
LRAERQALAAQMVQQLTRLSLAIDTQRRYKGLADQDYIAGEELRQKEIDVTEQRSRLQGLERETLGVERSLTQMEQEGNDTRLRFDNQIAQLRREISNTDQELTEVESRRRVVITAPEAGRATLVAAEVGQTADSVQPLVTLVPESAPLQARLYAPSSSIGFVQAGDTVLLRYAAFPYQKFGLQQGVVESVSTSALRPSEMAEVSSAGIAPDTSLFAIQVRLKSTHIEANGQARPLQAGMQLEADILQERRKLYEWMLEPLYSLTRRQAS